MNRIQAALLATGVLLVSTADANELTALVDYLYVNPSLNGRYVHLAGAPTFNGGGCSSSWAKGDLVDQNFMIYLWPLGLYS
jgi:hypothetical protein